MQSNGSHIDAVIFDIGGVLIDFDFELAFRAAAPVVGLTTAEIRDRLFGAADYANRWTGIATLSRTNAAKCGAGIFTPASNAV